VITLTVIALNDTPADGTLKAHFDELGGLIGRAETNQLVLPDPERMVSRVSAQVVYRNGNFAIIDRGSNPITLNGRALASGREAPLAAGDRLGICGYELSVEIGGASAATANDPFAALLGPRSVAQSIDAQPFDPLASRIDGIKSPAPAAAPQPGGIPLDWDPFAVSSPGVPAPGAASPLGRDALGLDLGGAAPAALVSGLPSATPNSLDQLFGLTPSSGGDPLKNSVLDAPMAQPNMAADADPLRSLKSAPKASAPSEADQLSDLNRPFIPPTVIKPAAPDMAAHKASAVPLRGSDPNATAMPSHAAARPRAAPVSAAVDLPLPAPPAPSTRPSAMPPVEHGGALLEAFRRGLNAPTIELPALTPELMELIGQLLHEAVGGTVDLVRARSTVKHELRAEVTTIAPKNNNPLKFSPNAEVALQHLLAPPARGFLAAAPAMRDTYDDLRAHQFAFVAGMQAVLEAALQRFDPATLEAQLGDRSLLQSLMPARRSARLWELFTEHYVRIRGDAADDFHKVFGKAFLKAYDAHVDRLSDQRGAKGPEA
jgi:FHA domain-containing protein